MEKMLINERFKSPNKEFEKVFNLFRKKDYFDEKSQVKKKQEEFVRFLKKGDPMATKVFKQNKEDMKSSLSFIEDMVMDYNKKNHFEAFQIFSKAVNNVEMKDSKSAENSGKFIKSKIHNNSQKYSLAIYSAIRKQKFNNYKDVHKDVDELISKNEGFSSDAQRKAAFANGYEEKDKKNEGKKRFKRQDGIGKAKYTISYHDGKKKHKDGSDFFDIKIFKNKKDLSDFVGTLAKQGYKLTRESVNEASAINRLNSVQDAREKMASYISFKKANNLNKKDAWFDKIEKTLLKKSYRDLEKLYLKLGGKRLTIKESVPQGYNPMVEDKKQIKDLVKKVKHEKLFYDVLDTMEKKYGKNKYRIWLEKSLKGFGVNPKHYDYRTNAGAEEKLFQLGK
jgi:hypothetical protein